MTAEDCLRPQLGGRRLAARARGASWSARSGHPGADVTKTLTAAWPPGTIVNNHLRNTRPPADYAGALSAGVTAALTMGAVATVLALAVTLAAIRARG